MSHSAAARVGRSAAGLIGAARMTGCAAVRCHTERVRSSTRFRLTDMDGVLVREEHALPGAAEFLARLVERDRPFRTSWGNRIR